MYVFKISFSRANDLLTFIPEYIIQSFSSATTIAHLHTIILLLEFIQYITSVLISAILEKDIDDSSLDIKFTKRRNPKLKAIVLRIFRLAALTFYTYPVRMLFSFFLRSWTPPRTIFSIPFSQIIRDFFRRGQSPSFFLILLEKVN